mmetsp:Transcript_1635/g.3689  ORF Transcript_1635/g.3689 Transcript_1635/m.3689 type:complete len:208 (+) Transcript_1635:275-898(+)
MQYCQRPWPYNRPKRRHRQPVQPGYSTRGFEHVTHPSVPRSRHLSALVVLSGTYRTTKYSKPAMLDQYWTRSGGRFLVRHLASRSNLSTCPSHVQQSIRYVVGLDQNVKFPRPEGYLGIIRTNPSICRLTCWHLWMTSSSRWHVHPVRHRTWLELRWLLTEWQARQESATLQHLQHLTQHRRIQQHSSLSQFENVVVHVPSNSQQVP